MNYLDEIFSLAERIAGDDDFPELGLKQMAEVAISKLGNTNRLDFAREVTRMALTVERMIADKQQNRTEEEPRCKPS